MITYKEAKQILDEKNKVPYPKLINVRRNPLYADIIYDQYAGQYGELSAITQYIYEHININQNEDIKKIMLQIAIEEMRHLDLIGELLLKLGGKAIYIGSNKKMWNASFLNYESMYIKDIMKYNIETEEIAIKGYKKVMSYSRNKSVIDLFERIIQDENAHLDIFKRIM